MEIKVDNNQDATSVVPVEKLSFEQAYQELERIVARLEEDNTLDQALALFERGQALVQHCASLLDRAELKVQQLSAGDLTAFESNQ
jgi:exodeoxyribonuclease VII small subunit